MAPDPIDALIRACASVLEDPVRGAADLERLAGSSPESAERLLRLVAAVPDPDDALAHLDRFARAAPLPEGEEGLRALLLVFGHSPYLAEVVLEDPEAFAAALGRQRAAAPTREEVAASLRRELGGAAPAARWKALRRFKEARTLDIALRDFLRQSSVAEVTEQLSYLADAVLGEALRMALEETAEPWGTPSGYDEEGARLEARCVLIGLGKLGGLELNYSSDVDLLMIYSHDGETEGRGGEPGTVVTNKEFFIRAAQILTRRLAGSPSGGLILRVDWGLRPGGRDGDLALPLAAMAAYYATWARPWEKQALVKARLVAGDAALGRQFMESVEGIVYPASIEAGAADAIRAMKDRIDAELAAAGSAARHLKLGRGGIREIEFNVQARQILHGGADPWLREGNTLRALHRLADKGRLARGEQAALAAAYGFLREAEHRIQIRRNLQRYTLPADARELRVLARSMGYVDAGRGREADTFLADLDQHRTAVRSLYDAFFASQAQERLEEKPTPDPFLDPMGDAEVLRRLDAAGWDRPQDLLGQVRLIARLLAPAAAPPHVRREFRRASPIVLREAGRLPNPGRALRNLARLLESLAVETGLLQAFLERPENLAPILSLFSGSQPLSALLIHQPRLVLGESLEQAVAAERSLEAHQASIETRLASCSTRSEALAALRLYQQAETLFIGLKDLTRQLTLRAACRALSDLAEASLRGALRAAAREGEGAGGAGGAAPGFCVLGLGRLGYREMDYGSDLDLVFVYQAAAGDAEAHAGANRLASRLVETLASITREGPLYAVDTRLRPYGSEGELAERSDSLLEYLGSAAGVWEMQSYLKARAVAGDLRAGERLLRRAERQILDRAKRENLAAAIRSMRARLRAASPDEEDDFRSGRGGTHTVQFALQYLQLRHHVPSPARKSTSRLLAALRDLDLIEATSYAALYRGHQFLRRLEHQIRLVQGRAITRVPRGPELLSEVARGLGYDAPGADPGEALLADLEERRREIETAFDRIVPAA